MFQKDQDPESQRNLLLAIALSLAVFIGWHLFYVSPRLAAEAERKKAEIAANQARNQAPGAPGTVQGSTPSGTTAPGQSPTGGQAPAGQVATRDAVIAQGPRHAIDTPSLKGSINLRGGRIDDLVLKTYREAVSPTSPNVVLLSPGGSKDAYFTDFTWIPATGSTFAVPGRDTVWTASGGTALTPKTPVTLTWDNGQGLIFKRTISVDDRFLFTVKDEVENKGSAPVALQHFARIFRLGTPKVEGWFILHEGMISVTGEKGLNEVTYADLAKDAETAQKAKKGDEGVRSFTAATGGWVGITDKYWATAIVPDQKAKYDSRLVGFKKTAQQDEGHQADLLGGMVTIAPGTTGSNQVLVYAGAKEVKAIDSYMAQHNIALFDRLVDWGWFFWITKPLFKIIDWLYGLLGNFGLAILAVTVLVKAAFFPLANKSYESMAKMKKLQPELERIRDLHKDDPMKQRTEMMELYKREKINPAAGCLPILLQIPVFFALYKVLFVTIDMRHAPFFGWIKDLSAADPTSIFNLFGLLPFSVPEFFQVGVWPILMGITMWIQMQLNPQQPDPIQ
ncbi:MAG: hypothetical protein RL291_279, partial [Pseudomonadota bacterium]